MTRLRFCLPILLLLPLGLLTNVAVADSLDDDLALVRNAVSEAAAVARAPQAEAAEPEPRPEPELAPEEGKPLWFRVRIQEKDADRPTVSVNVPLSLLGLLGDDDEPLDWLCKIHAASRKAGRDGAGHRGDLVHIEDEEATVRVWLE
jgi:hypothetical protein